MPFPGNQDHRAVVDNRRGPPRDLCDMASSAADIALAIKWAGKCLGHAFEFESATERADGLRELYQARATLNALIGEIEALHGTPAEPMGGEG